MKMKNNTTAVSKKIFLSATEKKLSVTQFNDNSELNKKKQSNDIKLNVNFGESILRVFIAIFIPWPIMFINPDLLLYAAPVMFYFFISGLLHFCIFKFAWKRWIKKDVEPYICDFAIELHIPVETI